MANEVSDALTFVLRPLKYLVNPQERIFLPYLLSSALIALWIHRREKRDADHYSIREAFGPLDVYLHRSAIVDYGYFITNAILYALILTPVSLFSPWLSNEIFQFLNYFSDPWHLIGTPGTLVFIAYAVGIALASDFGTFLSHYLFHRIPTLWEFHKVHHSAEVLTPISVYRMHPIDDFVTILLSGSFVAIIDALVRFFIAPGITVDFLFGLSLVTFFFYVFGYNLRHSHIWCSFGPFWSKIFISPAQHQIHHSKARKHWDKNFGLVFAIWDWMFGSLYVPVERETIEFGIGNGEEREFSSLLKLYTVPFVKVGRRIKKKALKLAGRRSMSEGKGSSKA